MLIQGLENEYDHHYNGDLIRKKTDDQQGCGISYTKGNLLSEGYQINTNIHNIVNENFVAFVNSFSFWVID